MNFETFDQSDEETWPDQKRSTYLPAYLPTYIPTLENTIQELVCQWHFHFSCIWAAVLFYTFDTYIGFMPLYNDIYLTKKYTYPPTPTYLPTYLSTYHREHPQSEILETCDLYDIWSEWWGDLTWPKKRPTYYLPTYLPCDTDYNTDNWEPGLMTIFVTWHLIVTLDSICNSCDVLLTMTLAYWLILIDDDTD